MPRSRQSLITDTATGKAEWRSYGYAAALVASNPLRFHAIIGRERAPLLRNPFTAPHHLQISDRHYSDAA